MTRNIQKRQDFSTEAGWIGVQRKIRRQCARHRMLNVCKYAAAIILPAAAAISIFVVHKNKVNETRYLEARSMEQIMPGGNKATLSLDNGETLRPEIILRNGTGRKRTARSYKLIPPHCTTPAAKAGCQADSPTIR